MKELYDVIESRIKSPLLGYFSLGLFVFNWKAFLLLAFSDGSIQHRIELFENATSLTSIVILPFLLAIGFSIIYPWIQYFFLRVNAIPLEWRNGLNLKSEHKSLLERRKLERMRDRIQADEERKIIEEGKRDEEVNSIEDESIKSRVKERVDKIRRGASAGSSFERANQLFEAAEAFRTQAADLRLNNNETAEILNQAEELERRGRQILQKETEGVG